jgi:TPP-dependent 2-oxoacid decarboxylase
MVNPVAGSFAERVRCSSAAAAPAKKNHKLDEAVRETVERLNHAKSPLILVGIESYRFKAAREIVALVERTGVPGCASVLAKGAFPMTHPQYMGVYLGAISPPRIRKRVEDAYRIRDAADRYREWRPRAVRSPTRSLHLGSDQSRECKLSYLHRCYAEGVRGRFASGEFKNTPGESSL